MYLSANKLYQSYILYCTQIYSLQEMYMQGTPDVTNWYHNDDNGGSDDNNSIWM